MINLSEINLEALTWTDCDFLYENSNIAVVINDGHVIGFEKN